MSAFQVVPWYNIQEWQKVYDSIYGQTSTLQMKQNALEHLLIWKARCPSLPSGIESTLSLLEVNIEDLNKKNEICSDHLIRLAYSSALMRFVNHMLDSETVKGLSLYQAAKSSGIPEWIIELRHNTAHSDRLSPIELLREATVISLGWLQNKYWDKHKQYIDNLVIGKLQDGADIEDKIAGLINFCMALSICSHTKCNIRCVSEIPDKTIKESLINDAQQLFDNSIDFSNLKLVSINLLVETMNSKSKKLLANDVVSKYVTNVLLSEESFFLSLELLNLLDNNNLNCTKTLGKQYVECFDLLLNFLHTNDLIQDFLLELIKFTQSDANDNKKCKLASQWVSVILKALKKNQLFMEKIYETETKDWSLKDKKEIYSLFYHWFPNKKKALLLDLRKSVPKDLTNLTYIQPIISTYNPYLTYFIKDLLNLVQPRLPDSIVERICSLAKIVAYPKFSAVSSHIYTVEDLKSVKGANVSIDITDDEIEIIEPEVTSFGQEIRDSDHAVEEQNQKFGIWQKASKNHAWSTCPFGQLPWQLIPAEVPIETMESENK